MKIPGQLGKQMVNLRVLTPRRPLGSPLKIAHSATRDSSGQPASSLRITQAQIDRSRPFLSYLDLSRPKSNSRRVPGQLSKEKVTFRSEELRILSISNCYPEKFFILSGFFFRDHAPRQRSPIWGTYLVAGLGSQCSG